MWALHLLFGGGQTQQIRHDSSGFGTGVPQLCQVGGGAGFSYFFSSGLDCGVATDRVLTHRVLRVLKVDNVERLRRNGRRVEYELSELVVRLVRMDGVAVH